MPDDVARLVFGTTALGLDYGLSRHGEVVRAPTEPVATALVHSALALGLTTFDTAPAYGASEVRLGTALGDRGNVWTKVGRNDRIDEGLEDLTIQSVDRSIRGLQRSRLDLVQWHNWTASLASNPQFRACWNRLRADPRIGALGASTYGREDALAAIKSGLFQIVQVEWNLLNQRVVEYVGETASRLGVSVAVRSVFLQGALTHEGRQLPALPSLEAGVARARTLATDLGLSLTALALRGALDHPHIARVLVGFDRNEQLDEVCAIAKSNPFEEPSSRQLRALDLGGDPAADPRNWH